MSDTKKSSELLAPEMRETEPLKLIFLLGRNGAGKDSKVEKAMKVFGENYIVLTMSNLLVKAQEKDPSLKEWMDGIMNSGELIPDEFVMGVLFEAIEEVRSSRKIVIVNGCPRTEAQADILLREAEVRNYVLERVIIVDLDEKTILERLSDRRVCPNRCPSSPYTVSDYHPPKILGICDDCGAVLIQRPDDMPEKIKKRIHEYDENEVGILKSFAHIKISRVNNFDGKAAQVNFNAILAEIAGK